MLNSLRNSRTALIAVAIAALTLGCDDPLGGSKSFHELYTQSSTAFDDGRLVEAQSLAEQALQKASKRFGSSDSPQARLLLGQILIAQNEREGAARAIEQAMEEFEHTYVMDTTAERVECLRALAICRERQSRYTEAIRLLEEAVSLVESHLSDALLAGLLSELADNYRHRGRYQDAADALGQASGIVRRYGLKQTADSGRLDKAWAAFNEDRGASAEAETIVSQALIEERRRSGSKSHSFAEMVLFQADLRANDRTKVKAKESVAWADSLLAEFETSAPQSFSAGVEELSAWLDHKAGRHAEAERKYRSAIATYEKERAKDHADAIRAKRRLGLLLLHAGKVKEAAKILHESIVSAQTALGSGSIELARCQEAVANCFSVIGNKREAKRAADSARTIRNKVAKLRIPSDPPASDDGQ